MALILPVLGLLGALIIGAKVAVLVWDIVEDMIHKPFNPRYMATWTTTLTLAVLMLGGLAVFVYLCLLTIKHNLHLI